MFKKWCTTQETQKTAANEFIAKFKQYHAPKNLIVQLENMHKETERRKPPNAAQTTSKTIVWCPM
eukprot:9067237-Lingulodinium_polyedra.AAC.1